MITDGQRYTRVAMILHWLIALAILAMLALGWVMVDLPRSDPDKLRFYQLHKSLGITVLALSLLRLGWRLAHRPPPLPAGMPAWQGRVAQATHVAFYALMIGLPLSGWMMVSASPWGFATRPWGLFTLPHLPWFATYPDKEGLEGLLKEVHETGALLMAALVGLHVAAALHHQFVRRDGLLLRMLPGRRPAAVEHRP